MIQMPAQDSAFHQLFTESELIQALRLLNPRTIHPDPAFVRGLMGLLTTPTGAPTGMNFRLFVALSLVSNSVQEFTKNWLPTVPDDVRLLFEKEREQLKAQQSLRKTK